MTQQGARVEFYTKAFFVAVAVLVGYLLLLVLQPFAGSMAWAVFLAFILYPLHRWLTRKLSGRNGLSAGIITGLTPFVLLMPLTFLGIAFVNQAAALVDYIQERNLQLDGSMLLQLEQVPGDRPAGAPGARELSVSAAGHPGMAREFGAGPAAERGIGRRRRRARRRSAR